MMFKNVLIATILVIFSFDVSAQLVVNEVGQGNGGNDPDEYVELIVVGDKTCTDSCANLQGWILDDNNGFYFSGSRNSGIAPGHIRFNNDTQWQCVPFGTIIVIYNPINIFPNITIDETDGNNDNVYFLPTTSSYFESATNFPMGGSPITTYAGAPYTAGGMSWSGVGMRNGGDAFHTVSPSALDTGYHSVGWGNMINPNIYFAGSASGLLFQNENITNNNPYLQSNWASQTQALGTPGLGNSVANIAWINAMRIPYSANDTTTVNETICDGDSIFFNNQYVHVLGTYKDTLVDVAGCDSIVTLNLTVEICTDCDMDLGIDTLICGPINMLLDAGTFDEYLWQDGSTNQTLTATAPGQYFCQGTNFDPTNLVVNPGFESGNVNFTTNYTVGTGGAWGLISNAGTYGISTSPSLLHNNFPACGDHTSGAGNMMVVNGSNTPNQAVWCQTITVDPNTDYYFSIWATSVENTNASNVSSLFFELNGTQIGTNFSPTFSSCSWQEYTQTWNSGASVTVDLCIYNHTIAGNNDFAIDDIFFGEACFAADTINILNNPLLNTTINETLCNGDSIFFNNQYFHSSGTYSYTLPSSQACDSTVTLNLTVQSCCDFQNYYQEGFEYNTAIPGIIPNTTYQTTPQTYCPYSGTRSFYGNFQNGFSGEFYNNDFDVCANAEMRFSFWTKDCFSSSNNINYEIRDANGIVISGPHNFINTTNAGWQQIISPPFVSSTNSITISMSNVTAGGPGNDISLDDFLLEICVANSTTNDVALCNVNSINLYDSLNTNNLSSLGVWTGPSTLFNGSLGTFNQTNQNDGLYTYSLTGLNNCPDTVNYVNVTSSLIANTISVSLCSNESYVLSNGTSLSMSGIYYDTLQIAQNCDSILTIDLTVSNIFSETITAQICSNDNYTLPNGQEVNTTGTYLDTLQSVGACDSVITTNLTVSADPITITDTVCTNIQAEEGQSIDTLFTVSECDSIYNVVNTTYERSDEYKPTRTICIGDSALIFNSYKTEAGVYFDTIFSDLGCLSLVTEFTLIVNPSSNINAGNDTSIVLGNSATLHATGATAYVWNTDETTATISVSPQITTNYIVEEENGCSSDSVTVFVISENVEILIPNAFTPNGDGLNDMFRIVNEEEFEEISISIYNRWGERVFLNNSTVNHWDGSYNETPQTEDNYTYFIKATAKGSNQKFNVSGVVALLR